MSDVAAAKAVKIIESGEWVSSGSLRLRGIGLRRIPEELLALRGLRALDLSGNRLRELPAQLFDLDGLEVLNVGNNRLDALPPQVGNLANLRALDASENRIAQLPREIGECGSLTEIDLYDNLLADVVDLPAVRRLDLSRNRLPSVPRLSAASSLVRLDLSANMIDELPETIAELRALRWLDLSGNRLTEVSSLRGLELVELYLDENDLTEPPSELAAMRTLLHFSAEANPFGPMPRQGEDVESLTERVSAAVRLNVIHREYSDDRRYLLSPAELILGFSLVANGLTAARTMIDVYYKRRNRISASVHLPDGGRIDLSNLNRNTALALVGQQSRTAENARVTLDPRGSAVDETTAFITQLVTRLGELELAPDDPTRPSIHLQLGGTYVRDYINVSGQNINVNSTLLGVVQTVGASAVDDDAKTQLTALIDQLSAALAKLPAEQAEDAEAVASEAERLISETVRERPNRKLISSVANTLRSLAEPLKTIAPIAVEIVKLVTTLVGG